MSTSPKHSTRTRRSGRLTTLLSRYVVVSTFAVGLATWHGASGLNSGLDRGFDGGLDAAIGAQRSKSATVTPLTDQSGQRLEVLGETQVEVDETLSATLVELTNKDRTRYRRKPYARTAELDDAAAAYAATLSSGKLVHATDLAEGLSPGWYKLGENLGRGRDIQSIHLALMASPTHRANVLDTSFTHVGIAVIRTDAGLVVVERFRQG